MIIRLEAEQISAFWDLFKFGVAQSARSDVIVNGESLNNVLKGLLSGFAQAWLVFEDTETGRDVLGIVVTYISIDPISEVRNLVVYALYGFKQAEDSVWLDGMDKLRMFAKDNRCNEIIGYTTSPILQQKLERYGFRVTFAVVGAKV